MYQNSQSYEMQFLRYEVRQNFHHSYSSFPIPHFLTTEKTKILRSVPEKCNRKIFFVIIDHFFCPYTPLTALKMKISKTWKKRSEISSIYTRAPKIITICCTVPEIWLMTDVIVIFILGYTFTFYLPNSQKSENLKKMDNMPGDIII